MKISVNERSEEIRRGRRQKMRAVARLSALVLVLNLVGACTSSDDSSANTANFSQSISRQFFESGSAECFDNMGNLDAAIYVYKDNPTRPDDIDNIVPDPVIVAPLVDLDRDNVNAGRFYTFTLKLTEDGNYGVAVVCNVSIDNPSSSEQLTYLSNRRYKVVFKETVGLINFVNQLPDHPDTGTAFCSPCHLESAAHDFLVTTVEHELIAKSYLCSGCHDAKGSARGQPDGHVSTTQIQDCGDCHVVDKWIDVVILVPDDYGVLSQFVKLS